MWESVQTEQIWILIFGIHSSIHIGKAASSSYLFIFCLSNLLNKNVVSVFVIIS